MSVNGFIKRMSFVLPLLLSTLTAFAQSDCLQWGYYGGDGTDLGTIGSGGTEYGVAIFVPGDGALKGGSIEGVKIPVNDGSAVTSMKAWITTDKSLSTVLNCARQIDVALDSIPKGLITKERDEIYVTVMFDSAFAIPEEGCYLGYTFGVKVENYFPTDYYAIPLHDYTFNDRGLYLYANNIGEWGEYGSTMGVSGMMALISGISMAKYDLTFSQFTEKILCADKRYSIPVVVNANAQVSIDSIEYRVKIGDFEEARVDSLSISAGIAKQAVLNVVVPAPADAGEYVVELQILNVNGEENSSVATVTSSPVRVVSREETRNTLMEEYTGAKCGWCSRGIVGMEVLREKYGDRFVGIAIHQFTASVAQDAMYFKNYRYHGMSSAPNCLLDNKINADPYYGTGYYYNICGDFEQYNSILPLVDIDLSAEWTDADKTTVRVDADVVGLCPGDYTISYALTADNLHGTTTPWAQANYMASCEPSSQLINNDPNLTPYASGGVYGQTVLYPYFNDVLVGSSYNEARENLATSLGSLATEETKHNSYTMTLPTTPASLRTQLGENKDKIYAIAVVWDKKGQVAQAKRVLVSVPASIMSNEGGEREVRGVREAFNLAGQRVDEDYKGIVVLGGKKMFEK